ncbi:hypothetical protein JK636_09430 [Clostridium sp. YIM B02515]|uniref:Uncharacterized protein n=1 Tax=Clostridium rhizosphaerae TaxID=2803861 RepID=A0ABS1T9Q1_9CLOT|nr:hypothetical protein [Clostridium rhizosphaerae]MBL4935981.1 hypothetical protein [Clostridium rhizosphaerae]
MANGNFANNLANFVGQTVTIFTTSGGQSGRGFTGVLATVNCSFVRLITQIGPAPGCALGNCCDHMGPVAGVGDDVCTDGIGDYGNNVNNQGIQGYNPTGVQGANLGGQQHRINCNANHGLGAVVDIPVDRIASFVHNAVDSGW